MRVLISGAGGFIGSHLTEACVRGGHSVRCIVHYNSRGALGYIEEFSPEIRSEIDVLAIDIRDAEAVHSCCRHIETIFHLAALIGIPYSYVAPQSYIDVNVVGTMHFLNAARRHEVERMVHTSTSEVYGSAQYVPIDEAHPLVAQSPYSASKIAADKLAESYAHSFEMPVTIIRPFNTYGPRQSLRAVIPSLASQLLDQEIAEVHAGTLDTVRDYTYVTDTASAYLRALEMPVVPGHAINLGTGVGYSIKEIYENLQAISGIRKAIVADEERVRPAASEVRKLIANPSRAQELLGWRAETPFEEGLEMLLSYVRAHQIPQSSAYRI